MRALSALLAHRRPHAMRFLARLPIGPKLALVVVALLVFTSTLLIATVHQFVRDMLLDEIRSRLSVTVSDRAAMIHVYVEQQLERAALVASRTRLRELLAEHSRAELDSGVFRSEAGRILLDAQSSTDDFEAIVIVDPEGHVLVATDDVYLGQSFAADVALERGRIRSYLGDPRPVRGDYQCLVSAPALDPDGRLLGVVLVVLNAEGLRQLVTEAPGLGRTGKVVLGALRDGTIDYLLQDTIAPDHIDSPAARVPTMARAVRGASGFEDVVDAAGVPVVAAFRPIGYETWGVVARIEANEAYSPLHRLRRTLMLLGGAFLIVGVVTAIVLARRLTRPVIELADIAADVAHGRLDVQIAVDSEDEIGRLKGAFNEMTRQLAVSYQSLERRVDERTAELRETNTALTREMDARKRAEAALAQKDKLASMGLLAAGVAHEVNNPLAYVLNNIAVIEREVRTSAELLDRYRQALRRLDPAAADDLEADRAMVDLEASREDLATALTDSTEGLHRMRDIVADLRDFARVDESDRKPSDLSALVESAAAIVRHELGRLGIELRSDLAPLAPIVCHGGKIKQVVCNLLVNAAHASSPGGIVELRTVAIDEDTVAIEVEDHGSGIAEGDLPRLFEPFFTTKAVGSGTGLGLSVSYGIVKEHGGDVDVTSEVGRGSLFRVRLPLRRESSSV